LKFTIYIQFNFEINMHRFFSELDKTMLSKGVLIVVVLTARPAAGVEVINYLARAVDDAFQDIPVQRGRYFFAFSLEGILHFKK